MVRYYRVSSVFKVFISVILVCVISFSAGFFWFIVNIPKQPRFIEGNFDLVVVLTGGKYRIDKGVEVFEKSGAQYLLISGVNKASKNLNLGASLYKLDQDRVIFGVLANSTYLNAIETQMLADSIKATKIALITSNYHIPRSQLLFKQTIKNAVITEFPVFSDNFSIKEILTSRASFILVGKEYLKFLLSFFFFFTSNDNMTFYLHEHQKSDHRSLIELKQLKDARSPKLFNACKDVYKCDIKYCKILAKD